MSNSTVKEPPHKKTKEEDKLLSSLPEAMVLNCLARTSRFDHAALSLVSSTYRSLMFSNDLYKARSLLGYTENYLYVCLNTPPPSPIFSRWFKYRLDKTLTLDTNTKKPNSLCLVPLSPSHPSDSSVVSLDWGIYVIGGKINGKPTSEVFLLDCRLHKWLQVTSMRVARASSAVGVVDGKIYVFGGCEDKGNWGEVFDPKMQTWDALPIPDWNIIHDWNRGSFVMDNKVYAWEDRCLYYYSPSEGKWGKGNDELNQGNNIKSCCVIDGLIYGCDNSRDLFWCEASGMDWKKVKGLEDLQRSVSGWSIVYSDGDVGEMPLSRRSQNSISRMSNVGGNLVVFWDMVVVSLDESLEIWCAEISLERREGGEIWGKTEWSDAVMTTDPLLYRPEVLHSVSVSI